MKVPDILTLLALSALWGFSFLFIRIAAPVLGPVVLVEVRVGLAAIVLIGILFLARQQRGQWRQLWREYLTIGMLNSVIPFTLIATAELHLTASLAAILNATTPLFTAIAAAIWLREALTWRQVAGLIMGFGGVTLLVGWDAQAITVVVVFSVGASLLAALSYALGGIYVKQRLAHAPPLHLALGQQATAAVVLLPFAVPQTPRVWPAPTVVFAVVALAVVCTAFAYLLFFRLMQRVGPTKTLLVTFLVPIFGLLWGSLFLHEVITGGTLVGMGIILASVVLLLNIRPAPRRTASVVEVPLMSD